MRFWSLGRQTTGWSLRPIATEPPSSVPDGILGDPVSACGTNGKGPQMGVPKVQDEYESGSVGAPEQLALPGMRLRLGAWGGTRRVPAHCKGVREAQSRCRFGRVITA